MNVLFKWIFIKLIKSKTKFLVSGKPRNDIYHFTGHKGVSASFSYFDGSGSLSSTKYYCEEMLHGPIRCDEVGSVII